MAAILDILEDIVQNICIRYLFFEDIGAASSVSREFRVVFKPILYHSILWVIRRHKRVLAPAFDQWTDIVGLLEERDNRVRSDLVEPHIYPRRWGRDAHLLFPILRRDGGLAARVQGLGFLADCVECQATMSSQSSVYSIPLKSTMPDFHC